MAKIRCYVAQAFVCLTLFIAGSLWANVANAQQFVQQNSKLPASGSQIAVPYTAAQTAGNLNVVIAGWNDTSTTITSVTDSKGNTYQLAVGPTLVSGTLSQSIYFAKNIAAATAGANTVTVKFSATATYPDIRILEYSGLDTNNPLDVSRGATGSSSTTDSGAITTTNANDLLVGANTVSTSTSGPGSGYTSRVITNPDGDIAEDQVVTATGTFHATASLAASGQWIMQIVAFKAAGAAPAPTAPGSLVANAISTTQINLTWTASTETGGTIASYLVERCTGTGCTSFTQVGTSTTTNYSDTTLASGTTYLYRVRAQDTANSVGPYSNTASAMTAGTAVPTAPGNLTAVAGASGAAVIATQSYINSVALSTHTTATFDSTGGDAIVICASSHSGVTFTPSDSFGNNWISIAGPTSTTTGFDLRTQVWYARNPTVGPNHTVTMNLSAAQSLVISIIVVKGSNIASPIDVVSPIGDDAGTQTINISSPSITTTVAGDLLIGFAKPSVGENWTPGSGFTIQAAASSSFLEAETGAATTPGSYAATFFVDDLATWQAVVIAIRPAAANPNQVNLTWTASTEAGGTIGNYLIERCTGSGCTSFTQIATSTTMNYTDTNVTGGTTYVYRVRASDTFNVDGPYSNSASATTGGGLSPTGPTNLTATAASSTQVNLSWTAATEAGGTISSYLVESCAGSGCTNFAQVGSSVSTTYTDSGLTGSTAYTYRVRAQDALGNDGPYSTSTTATTAPPTIAAPSNLTATAISSTQVNLAWTAATETGGTISTYLIERCAGSACANFVQVATSTSASYSDSGLLGSTTYQYRVRAQDVAGNLGPYSNTSASTTAAPTLTAPTGLNATVASSTQINLTWTAATEAGGTIANYLVERCQGAGCTSFAQIGTSGGVNSYSDSGLAASTTYLYRVRATDAPGNLGPYSTSATATTLTATPTAPTNLTATATGNTQISLSWTAATETGGTISSYSVERCAGSTCTTFAQVGTTAALTFGDTGLTGSTTYRYRVRALDTLGTFGPYSAIATATTAAPTITAPTGLTATAASNTQINLSWTAATETGGTLSTYLIERCTGSTCTNFAQIATSASTSYSDVTLLGSTTYQYRVRAQDTSGNLGPYSNSAAATTAAPTFTAPTGLTATTASSTQINLAWSVATETGGTISSYLVESCQGSGCTNFTQIGTSATATFSNVGLLASTSYSYRVRATDASGNLGPYSNTATATTATATPTAPTNLTATAASSTQINLSWTAATEAGGTISSYSVERCAGSACTNFAQVGTTAALTFGDTGLTGSTAYRYRVRALDSLNNFGPYSAIATATTAAPTITAPTGLTATAASNTQVNLSWTAATETGGTISTYLIERCAGAGCTSFAQIATSTATTFSNTGLTGSTTYLYRVRAQDTTGNNGPYSATASATTAAPTLTAPTGLTATAASSAQINLAWTAATETGGTITNYRVERCQGAGCTAFVQVATSTTVAYSDTGLTALTTYLYRVRAADAAGNLGPYSATASATTSSTSSGANVKFVQQNSKLPASGSQIAVPYTTAQTAGNLNVVIAGWNDTSTTITSVTDSKGNTYQLAVGPTLVSGTLSQSIYFAKNIAAATAGANTVTVKFSATATYPDIRILEYSGLDTNNPLDVSRGATGSSSTTDSGAITTTNANDLLVGANTVSTSTSGPGSGYTSRVITNPDGDIAEDQVVTATGTFHATAALAASGQWIMQIVAFKAAGAAPAPTAPGSLVANAISTTQINLTWTASTETGGTIANYLVERCTGTGCTNFTQVATSTTTNYSDTTLASGTTYLYRVRAQDTANSVGPYSNTASATTAGTAVPTAPGNLTAVAGASGAAVIATQSYINSTALSTHTTATFDSTGGDAIVICASSHSGVTFTPSDSFGNNWISIAGPTSTTTGFDLRTQVWYARNPTVGPNHTVTMNLSAAQSLVISIIVVKGSNIASPIDVVSPIGDDAGTQTINISSPSITTTVPGDLLIGFAKPSVGENWTPGSGFTIQAAASSSFLEAETGAATTPGSYAATFFVDDLATWQAVVVAIRPAAANPNQVNLTWTASTEAGGTIGNYLIERCMGSGCTSFTQVATSTTTNYTDTNVTGGTTYVYRVRASDTFNVDGPYSNSASVALP